MIRINLVADRTPVVARKQKSKAGLGDIDPSNLILGAGLLVGLLAGGAWWWVANGNLKDVENRVRRARATYAELEPIIEEVNQFEKKRGDLQNKVKVIQDLKDKQKGPVFIMDQVSRALPDLVWLETMQVTGRSVTMRGRAFNTAAIATFIENVDKVPEFQEPFLRDIQQQQENLYSFAVDFNFVLVQPPTEGEDEEETS